MKAKRADKGKWVAISAILLMVFLTGWTGDALAKQETFKIGCLGEMTGGFAPYYNPSLIGEKLAVDEINASGGVLGKKLRSLKGM